MSAEYSARVDESGNVYAIEPEGERLVGQYADVPESEAVDFFVRKFNDTNASLVLIEQRVKNNSGAKDLGDALSKVEIAVSEKHGIGNYSALQARIDALKPTIAALLEADATQKAEAIEKAKADRLQLVLRIEALAAQDPQKIQWKNTTSEVDQLFSTWQDLQKIGPRLPKNDADELWKRFRNARQQLDKLRRAYFSELDSKTKEAKTAKESLIAQAVALAPKGAEGIADYRLLLEKWKKSPRANKKLEDSLWQQFKVAGDVLYNAKKTQDAAEDESFAENLTVKLSILENAEKLLQIDDPDAARTQLTNLTKQWDKAGKVPRAHLKSTEERMRKVEQHVKKLEDQKWAASDPEKQARQDGLAGQITKKIADLENLLSEETDKAKISELQSALDTQREWLKVVS